MTKNSKGFASMPLIVLLVVVVAGVAWYSSTAKNDVMEPENGEVMVDEAMMEDDSMMGDDAMEGEHEGAMMDGDVKVFEMDGENFRFSKEEIRVNQGDTVRVVLTSIDFPHDFVVEGMDVSTDIAAVGETVEVEFTVTEAGEYEFYCSVGNHRAQGMIGTLIVE